MQQIPPENDTTRPMGGDETQPAAAPRKKGRVRAFFARPPAAIAALVYVLALGLIAASIALTVSPYAAAPFAAAVYAPTAAALGYSVFLFARLLPACKRALLRLPGMARLRADYGFRTVLFASFSFACNIAFAAANGVSAVRYGALWYGALAGYYLCLSLLRCGVLIAGRRARRRHADDPVSLGRAKWKIFGGSGVALLLLELAMTAAVVQMTTTQKPHDGGQVMAIAAAAYTFYKATLAGINLVRARRYRDPVIQVFRNINLTDAAVSVLALQVTLIAAFGEGNPLRLLTALTGAAVCALTIAVGIYMIARAAYLRKGDRDA